MKILLLVVLVFAGCSTNKTVTVATHEASSTEQGTLISLSPSAECEDMRSTLVGLVKEHVPELMEVGEPYVKRISSGRGNIQFILRCPIVGADDTLMTNYYEIGSGFSQDTEIPIFWYRVFISKDLQRMLIGEFGAIPPQPIEIVRRSEKWMQDWQGRR